jgi:NADH-quinone oxidoreductase subunit D
MSISMERLPTQKSQLSWGPIHPGLPAPMRLDLKIDGERIVAAQVEVGFLHKGLEKSFEGRNWFSAIVGADRLDSSGSAFSEMALCLAVEEICNIQVPRRAQSIRLILSELNRVSNHLEYLAKMAQAVGFETTMHYILRERESILDLFELMTGSRFNLGFFRYGGVVADITEGFIERVFEVCRQIQIRIKEYHALMIDNEAFVSRLAWLGTLSAEDVYTFGITGPNARASGVQIDVRKSFPYSGYELVEFTVPAGRGTRGSLGDSFDRLMVRLEEVQECIHILTHVAERVPAGDFACIKVGYDFTAPAGESFSRVESARGYLGCHAISSGESSPVRIQWRTPSSHHIRALPKLLRGVALQDVSVLLASLDLCISEVDK